MSHDGELLGGGVLGRDVPGSNLAAIAGREADVLETHAVVLGRPDHRVCHRTGPGRVHDGVSLVLVHSKCPRELLKKAGFSSAPLHLPLEAPLKDLPHL